MYIYIYILGGAVGAGARAARRSGAPGRSAGLPQLIYIINISLLLLLFYVQLLYIILYIVYVYYLYILMYTYTPIFRIQYTLF